jgi:transcriptional regulator with GAF, ATPase, and Fis domain
VLSNALRDHGVDVQSFDAQSFAQGHAAGAGLVLFERCSDELLEFCRQASDAGASDRILAIALPAPAAQLSSAWSLLHSGVGDVFTWESAAATAQQVAAKLSRWQELDEALLGVRQMLVGDSRTWRAAMRRLVELGRFTDAPVLIEGESGTGKELAARLIHSLDGRPNKPELVVLDCTTIVPELSGSEFFGHEKGAYTGAATSRDGAFALANGGTLFLDEVGELPPVLQAQLLRVIQEKTYKRVGGNAWQSTRFRLVCATNRDLPSEVERGTFRRDLYYRIASATCRLPPLRQRREDIVALVQHFLTGNGERAAVLEHALVDYLVQREYPGNVRDLRQLVARISYRHVGTGPYTAGDLPMDDRPELADLSTDWREGGFEGAIRQAISLGVGLKAIGKAAEDLAVRLAVEQEAGNLQRAASRLGVTDRALQLRRAQRSAWSD